MKSALPILCTSLLLATSLNVQAEDSTASSRVEIIGYHYDVDTWSRSAFHRIARQPADTWNTETRPDLSWQQETLSATLRPRFQTTTDSGATHTSGWLNEGWLRFRPAAGLSLQAGREVMLWGPSMFWNPSNPFFTANNKANPKREIAGKDFLRGRWQIDPQFALTLISQTGRGHRTGGNSRMDGLKLDWIGDESSAAAIFAAEPGKAPSWQGWEQHTASDAILLYGEAAWRSSAAYTVPESAAGPTGLATVSRGGSRALSALVGLSYTFENDWTLNAEAWRNGNGLDGNEADRLARAIPMLAAMPYGLADRQLAALITEPTPLRRHYAGLQLGNGDAGSLSWKVRLTRNLDDHGMEGVIMLDRDFGDVTKLWFNAMHRVGHADSEYGRWIRSSTMIGISWFAF